MEGLKHYKQFIQYQLIEFPSDAEWEAATQVEWKRVACSSLYCYILLVLVQVHLSCLFIQLDQLIGKDSIWLSDSKNWKL